MEFTLKEECWLTFHGKLIRTTLLSN